MSQPFNSSSPGSPGAALSDAALDALIVREQTRVVAPLMEWHLLAGALRNEGLIRPGAASAERPAASYTAAYPAGAAFTGSPARQRGAVSRWFTRGIAAVVLVGSGVLIGRGVTLGDDITRVIREGIQTDSVEGALQGVARASGDEKGADAATFASATDARRALVESQSQYLRASAYLAANGGQRDTAGARLVGDPELYQQRLAALDEMANVTQHALKDAPHDPVLNQYYQSTVGAREATMQQLNQSLPVGVQLSHY